MKLATIAPQEQPAWQCKTCGRSRTQCECDQLDEKMADYAAAALIGAAALFPSKMVDHLPPKPSAETTAKWKAQIAQKEAAIITAAIKSKYKGISEEDIAKIFALAKKHEKAVFPKAADILAIVGIESSYKKEATSGLKKDPAKGLMQVRPGVWGIDVKDLATIEQQIKFGSEVLSKYYEKLKDADKAVHAYNIGITNFRKGTGLNPGYVAKFHKERDWLVAQWKKVTTS
jgi:soluble lytic murein transglycosylase-like protein